MKYLSIWMVAAWFCCSCKVTPPIKKAAYQSPPDVPQASSCSFEGTIISILNTRDEKPPQSKEASPCADHPCLALVLVNDVSGCGPGVSILVNKGDTVQMRFGFTLDKTDKIFPKMYAQYPGLKEGDTFQAKAQQRLVPGSDGEFVVYGYKLK